MSAPTGGRLERARAALRDAGVMAGVDAAGPNGEIAALTLAEDAWARLAEAERRALIDAIRAVGFRYVALDLDA